MKLQMDILIQETEYLIHRNFWIYEYQNIRHWTTETYPN